MDQKQIDEVVTHPAESLGLEMKSWIDPDTPEGKAKIVKACIALRNNDGGMFLVGFNDRTGAPEQNKILANVRTSFHVDKIQALIAKHASEPFEIEIGWAALGGVEHPVLIVPSGVRSPIATKSAITDGGTTFLQENRVYVRSLHSNNTVSTTEATWKDWPTVVQKCFENREADVGRFIRRHLTPDVIQHLLGAMREIPPPPPSQEEQARAFLLESASRFEVVRSELPSPLPPHGAWEAAAVVVGPVNQLPTNTKFLNLIGSANPKYTGWPLWLDTRHFANQSVHPRVYEGAWEVGLLPTASGHIDFWRASGGGKFYHRRALEDDTVAARMQPAPEPGTVLDFDFNIYRTTEAIAVPLVFVREMGGTSEETAVAFCFRWSGLRGRTLSSWSNPSRFLFDEYRAHQDEYVSTIVVPVETTKSAISAYTNQVLQPLFDIFDGIVIEEKIVDQVVDRVLSRKW